MGGKVVRFRTRPEVPASIRYTPDELAVLCAQQKKTLPPPNNPRCPRPN